MMFNRDIGFVSAGQQAEVKIDTFNLTRYGLLQEKVVSVAQDAIVQDRPNAKRAHRNPAARYLIRASLGTRRFSIRRRSRSIEPKWGLGTDRPARGEYRLVLPLLR